MKKLIFISLVLFASCQKEASNEILPASSEESMLLIPDGFPAMKIPADNAINKERWTLGKRLFYEKRLSIDKSISCASCHKTNLAFADNQATSPGVFNRPGKRNAPSLANVGYQPYLLREGSVPTLEMQVLVPIQEHNEFNHNIVQIVADLSGDSSYVEQSKTAYGRSVDAFVITRALATFQRTLTSGNSDYDKYTFQGDFTALSEEAKRGMQLFFSPKTNCSSCHGGFNFTNYQFENNGLEEQYRDMGRLIFTNDSADASLFKVPSLRNVSLTAPYMHDGRFQSLQEVIEHYNSGGKNHPNKSHLVKALQLADDEKRDLISFLNSLSDHEFVSNPRWSDPNSKQ